MDILKKKPKLIKYPETRIRIETTRSGSKKYIPERRSTNLLYRLLVADWYTSCFNYDSLEEAQNHIDGWLHYIDEQNGNVVVDVSHVKYP